VQRTPDAVALVCRDERLTYAELDARANQLAHALRARGVAPETRVAICLPRAFEVIASRWGAGNTGGA